MGFFVVKTTLNQRFLRTDSGKLVQLFVNVGDVLLCLLLTGGVA